MTDSTVETRDASSGTRPWLSLTVATLTERWPETMRVLAPLGIDLCCGGGREVGEALRLHGADLDEVLPELDRMIAA